MIKRVHKVPVLIFTALFVLVCSGVDASGDAGELPLKIDRYYRDYNFVSSSSTPAERHALAKLFRLTPVDDSDCPLSDQLRKTASVIKELTAKTWSVDPGIRIPRRGLMKETLPAELVSIHDFRITKDSITVHAKVYCLEPEVNKVLVSLYEKYSIEREEEPSLEARLALVQQRAPRAGIHQWLRMNGRWMLKEAKIVLLD